MHIFDFYNNLRDKKNIAFFLDGNKSLKILNSFVAGYELGNSANQGTVDNSEDMRAFNIWVAEQLHYPEATSGWCAMILSAAGSDEKAFDLFFELLDKYRKERGA